MNPLIQKLLLLVLPAVLMTTGCDLHLLPETYQGQGERAAIVTVEIGSLNAELLDPEVESLEIQILDVLAHRSATDEWLILNESSKALTITHDDNATVKLSEVPLPVGEYDSIMLIVAQARVDGQGGWTQIQLSTDDIEIQDPVLIDTDGKLTLSFDMENSLEGTYSEGLVMNPQVLVQTN
jgi:hypothetical protein